MHSCAKCSDIIIEIKGNGGNTVACNDPQKQNTCNMQMLRSNIPGSMT